MPELPDVECYRLYLSATSLHQIIVHAHIRAPEILEDTTPQGLGRRLHGRSFDHTYRHGKFLFVTLDDDAGSLVFHFGMSGGLHYFKAGADEPPYTDARFDFAGGFHLAYTAPRKLGVIRMVTDINAFITARRLGCDALRLDYGAFRALATRRRGGVKSWLMDQTAMAGIGNIYSDEILFHAGLHPRAPVKELNDEALHLLFESMRSVLQTAIEARVNPQDMPDSWLLPHRTKGGRCPRCGATFETLPAAGRTAYICPHCQPKPASTATNSLAHATGHV